MLRVGKKDFICILLFVLFLLIVVSYLLIYIHILKKENNQLIYNIYNNIEVLQKDDKVLENISDNYLEEVNNKQIVSRGSYINRSVENKTYLGKFKITHYCACTKCCGTNAKGITASGKQVEENKTIAVDTKVIKMRF